MNEPTIGGRVSLDTAYCADGCGRLAERERPYADGGGAELVCREHETLEVS